MYYQTCCRSPPIPQFWEKPNQTQHAPHAPNIEECGRYTFYARNPSPYCIGKLTNYFACPNQGRVAGFVRNEAQSASVMLSWMRKAIEMEDDVSQNPDVNELDKCVEGVAIALKYSH
ncbi:hypothetical protein QUA41_25850 [Microcoleus sp. Pol11C1]|uniref:hypothetical protein n=1 Tax=unclassified Microcoleus TaxID=2642155 RepID=UPI002FD1D7CE